MLVAVNWRFIFWLLMWICALAFVTLSYVLPETLASNILHRRAKRVRQQTGDVKYRTKEQEQSKGHKTHIGALIIETVWRPIAIIGSEPGVLAFDLYMALLYGTRLFGFLRGVCIRVWSPYDLSKTCHKASSEGRRLSAREFFDSGDVDLSVYAHFTVFVWIDCPRALVTTNHFSIAVRRRSVQYFPMWIGISG
jgi:hypothetical protein